MTEEKIMALGLFRIGRRGDCQKRFLEESLTYLTGDRLFHDLQDG